ncbi:MAG: hypothetical protein IT210_19850 [Armatimonadetes bacterium]|nr:hypothetical protein [Armatimonadota bacterium]
MKADLLRGTSRPSASRSAGGVPAILRKPWLGIRARDRRFPFMKSCIKRQPPAFASGISAVQRRPSFWKPVMSLPPSITGFSSG